MFKILRFIIIVRILRWNCIKIEENKKLDEKDIREMLGLIDKRKIILLLLDLNQQKKISRTLVN